MVLISVALTFETYHYCYYYYYWYCWYLMRERIHSQLLFLFQPSTSRFLPHTIYQSVSRKPSLNFPVSLSLSVANIGLLIGVTSLSTILKSVPRNAKEGDGSWWGLLSMSRMTSRYFLLMVQPVPYTNEDSDWKPDILKRRRYWNINIENGIQLRAVVHNSLGNSMSKTIEVCI